MLKLNRGSPKSKEAASFMERLSEHEREESSQSARESSNNENTSSGKDGVNTSTSSFSLARAETRMVMYSKFGVLAVILLFTAAIGTLTYWIVYKQEDQEFRMRFHDIANEITEFAQLKTHNIFNNMERFAVSITSYALATNTTWPFLVYPDFQVQGILSNRDTGAHTLTINPIVYKKDIDKWTEFSSANQDWMVNAHAHDKTVHEELYEMEHYITDDDHVEDTRWNNTGIVPYIWKYGTVTAGNDHEELPVGPADFYTPVWQRAPAADFHPDTNLDLRSLGHFDNFIDGMIKYDHPVITEVTDATYLDSNYEHRFDPTEQAEPHSYLLEPIYNNLTDGREMVAFLAGFLRWGNFFDDVLPESEDKGIVVVLHSSCTEDDFTYEIHGHHAEFLGTGDVHDTKLHNSELHQNFEFAPFTSLANSSDDNLCHYSASIYPSDAWREQFFTGAPFTYAAAVVGCFMITTVVFILYDCLVQKRQNKVMASAKRTNAIVNSLFPANVRDRLLEEVNDEENKKGNSWNNAKSTFVNNGKQQAAAGMTSEDIFGSKPIADLFPETTIMFADMVGFTAWSSVREPSQVFSLLELVYHSFDVIAKRRRIFKVETVGDCYVAVAGLPVPRKEHAIVMMKFANDCLLKMKDLVQSLETTLGPDTADLNLRIGLHSGPVTAGVLRGEKGRFQLFGDTMNTASRMESTGMPGKIQVTRDTAELLINSGKDKWVTEREDEVVAKGKGNMQTYWVKIQVESNCTGSNMTSKSGGSNSSGEDMEARQRRKDLALGPTPPDNHPKTNFEALPPKVQRLVSWNVDLLLKSLRQIIARRASLGTLKAPSKKETKKMTNGNGNLLDEVQDVLALPQFDAKMFQNMVDPSTIEIPSEVIRQLTDYIARVAALYHKNHFHNFEHASHVTMSVSKLLSRIVNPIEVSTQERSDDQIAANLHDHTFGITSDPLTQFACVLSALIHDADHPGVPNMTLVKEEHPLAAKYNGKSVAEQNSVDLAWDILMSPEYKELQTCIYGSKDEYDRFRSIIVNVVMATDIMDKDLGSARKARWTKAFAADEGQCEEEEDKVVAINRKATIVLEHLMQASDVSHTMQHWHVFKKWNERLFREVYQAYVDGHSETDPSKNWYKGEMGFFDFYIIPLAKKLDKCGVFGVSSQEYLNYAQKNRREWEEKGEQLVEGYLKAFPSRTKSGGEMDCS